MFLWLRNDDLRQRLDYASFNDKAWQTLEEYRGAVDELETSLRKDINQLLWDDSPWKYWRDRIHDGSESNRSAEDMAARLRADSKWSEWLGRIQGADKDWLTRLEPPVSKAKSKMAAYESASQSHLPAAKRFSELLVSEESPSARALKEVQVRARDYGATAKTERWISPVNDTVEDMMMGEVGASIRAREQLRRENRLYGVLAGRLTSLAKELDPIVRATRSKLTRGSAL